LHHQYALLKKRRARGKNRSFLGVGTSGRGGNKKRENEGEYGGRILYLYMKIEK
jgi:hypothetical protein